MKVLKAKGLTKIFPGVVALDDVTISFEPGRVHCIVGENGAGKSTLIKCLTGVYKPEEGEIHIDGKSAQENPELFAKVVSVPQEIDLFQYLSVAENLFIPYEQTDIKGLIKQSELETRARPIIEAFGIHAEPGQLVRDLSVADQQLLQIARATMRKNYQVIILDEPTSSLTDDDVKRVFSVVKTQKENGIAIIYISHKLNEIFAIGDDVTVFRNGQKIASDLVEKVDEGWIVQKMIGKHLSGEQVFYSNSVSDEEILKVENLYGAGFMDVSFNLKKGEILGFSGLIGAGRTELLQTVYGYRKAYSGRVTYCGQNISGCSPADSVKKGLVYLPEDRKKMGLLPMMDVRSNVSILSLSKLVSGLAISKAKEKTEADKTAIMYGVHQEALERQIRTLSGGNQQKAIVARSMMAEPKVIILDEPTKGIDVGAKYEIYRLMKDLAEAGFGVIFISSELEEIVRCCNRIMVMYEGEIISELPQNPDKEALMSALIGCPIQTQRGE